MSLHFNEASFGRHYANFQGLPRATQKTLISRFWYLERRGLVQSTRRILTFWDFERINLCTFSVIMCTFARMVQKGSDFRNGQQVTKSAHTLPWNCKKPTDSMCGTYMKVQVLANCHELNFGRQIHPQIQSLVAWTLSDAIFVVTIAIIVSMMMT